MKPTIPLTALGLALALPALAQAPAQEQARVPAAIAEGVPPPQVPAAGANAAPNGAAPGAAAAEDAAPLDPEEAERLKQREAAEARRKAAAARRQAWEDRCQIKPVMSDREIEICREVATQQPPK